MSKRNLLIAVLPAALALGPSPACQRSNTFVPPPPPEVTVRRPLQKSLFEYRAFTGTTKAVATVEVRARVEGRLQKRHFEEGDFVEKDQLLYTIDPEEHEIDVQIAQASVEVAEAALKLAEATYSRMKRAAEKEAVSELQLLESEGARDQASATLAERKAQIARAKLDLGYTEIPAPISGRIGLSLVDDGNLVGYGENTLLTTIVQLDPIYVDFDINERDILEMRAQAREKLAAVSREQWLDVLRAVPFELGLTDEGAAYPHRGRLFYIDPDVDPGTGTVLVRGEVANPYPGKIRPGFFARVRLMSDEPTDALLVSERAIGTDQGGKFLLVVDAENVVQYRRVTLGAREGTLRVIASGVTADDRVIVDGMLRARPGSKVTPLEAPTETGGVAAPPGGPRPDAQAEEESTSEIPAREGEDG